MRMDAISSQYEPRGDTGVNEAIIRCVIPSFYEPEKCDESLGPVFAAMVGNDWDAMSITYARSGFM
jgi:hypothetical protein